MKTTKKTEALKNGFIAILGKHGIEAKVYRAGVDELIRAVVLSIMPTEEEIKGSIPYPECGSDRYQLGKNVGWIRGARWFRERIKEYIDADFDRSDTDKGGVERAE